MRSTEQPKLSGPLVGLKVVEIAGLGPITFAGMLLADMGADVVRIVRPGHTDMEKGPTLRGRRELELDLRTSEGRDSLLKLLGFADVLIEGFRPGVMERLMLGPTDVMSLNKRLVYGRMTGWGQTGPRSLTAGHDINYIAVSGALHGIGGEEPVVPLNLIGDYGGGALYLAMGVLAAVLNAQRTCVGQVVDCAICDGTVSLLSLMHGLRNAGRWQDKRQSNVLNGAAPYYRTYRCKDGKDIAVGAIEPKFYQVFLERLQLEKEALFEKQHDRTLWTQQANALQQIFAQHTRDELVELFCGTDACVAPVNSLQESIEDPHIKVRESFTFVNGETQPAPAPRFSKSPTAARAAVAASSADELVAAWRTASDVCTGY